MPEEVNRIVADRFSELLFLHSEEAIENLRAEGIADERMHMVGNTMIDTLVALEDRFRAAGTAARLGVEPGAYALVTLHRPALVDGPLLPQTVAQLAALAREMPVVFPVHPRTRKMMESVDSEHPGLLLIEPLGYLDFLSLLADAGAVLTDSGGIQEETTYLGIPCFTLRDNTERPVTVRAGTNTLLGLDPAAIAAIPAALAARGDAPRAAAALGRPRGRAHRRRDRRARAGRALTLGRGAVGRGQASSAGGELGRAASAAWPRQTLVSGARLGRVASSAGGSRSVDRGRCSASASAARSVRRRRLPASSAILSTSLLGASSMLMLRPSCSGADSITAMPPRSSKSFCSSARPRSGWACSRPRNMIVTLTLSWCLRKRSTWPFLVS